MNGRQWCNVEAIERAYKRDEQEKQNKQKTRRNASKETLEKKNIYNCTNRDAQWYEPRCPTQVQD